MSVIVKSGGVAPKAYAKVVAPIQRNSREHGLEEVGCVHTPTRGVGMTPTPSPDAFENVPDMNELGRMDQTPLLSTNLIIRTWRASSMSRAEVARRLANADIKRPTKINVTRRAPEVSKKLSSMGFPHREEAERNDGVDIGDGSTSGHKEVHIDDTL